jgi:glycosyltransferase involved in cell wall biosynthesis
MNLYVRWAQEMRKDKDLKVATLLSHFPTGNIRYAELMRRLIGRVNLHVWATIGSGYPKIEGLERFVRVILPIKARIGRPYATRFLGPLAATLIRADHPDIYWLFDTSFSMRVYRTIGNVPFVLDVDDPDFSSPPNPLLYDRRVKTLVVPTEAIRSKLVELYGIDRHKIKVIPNGVDLRKFTPSPLRDSRTVIYVGTLAPHRSEFLSEVIREVCSRDKSVRFVIVGYPTPNFVRSIGEFLDRVELKGYVKHDELPRYIRQAAVGVFPQSVSFGRCWSVKLLEYMACGRPIVATDVDESFPIKLADSGIITPLDPVAFAEAILKLLDDRELAEEMGMRGASFVKDYDWNRITELYIKVFLEAVER